MLRKGGLLAAFWNRIDWSRCDLGSEFDAAYERSGARDIDWGPMRPEEAEPVHIRDEWQPELAAAAGFGELEIRRYDRELEYTADEYVALLSTHSDHILLAPDVRARLFADLRAIIDGRGGVLWLPVPTLLCLGRAG